MTYAAAAAIVGAGISAFSSNSSSKKSAKGNKDALRRQEELQAPFREAGLAAQNRLLQYMGLTTEGYDGGEPQTGNGTPLQGDAAGRGKQYLLANGRTNPGIKGKPSRRTGMGPNAEGFGKYSRDFGESDFQADPGYQFRLKEGLKELDRKAAMRGGSLGGNALRAGQEYGQNMASNEYQNAFNRYQINRSNQLNPLQSLMGSGQTASNTLTDASGTAIRGAADARASGYIGVGNAINQGISSYTNYNQGKNQLDAYNKRTAAMGGRGGGGGGGYDDYNISPRTGGLS